MQKDGVYYYVDYSEEVQRKGIREGFGGDPYAMTRYYFEILAQFPQRQNPDIIAHFDLVTKFNEGGKLFDEDDPRYWKPALETMEYLCAKERMFEINTGAMSRGYRSVPYPSARLLRALREFGGRIVLNCDSHSVDTVCSFLPEAAEIARACGFESHCVLTSCGWQEVALGE
jgi:histidinol-phosphatase (PHP family)